jgi:hypothetical protein
MRTSTEAPPGRIPVAVTAAVVIGLMPALLGAARGQRGPPKVLDGKQGRFRSSHFGPSTALLKPRLS